MECLAPTILIQEQDIASGQVDSVCGAQSRYLTRVSCKRGDLDACHIQPPPTTMTLGADAVAILVIKGGLKTNRKTRSIQEDKRPSQRSLEDSCIVSGGGEC